MTTTYANSNRPHNIHGVAFADAHTKGIPRAQSSLNPTEGDLSAQKYFMNR
jgi:hypothetical protein